MLSLLLIPIWDSHGGPRAKKVTTHRPAPTPPPGAYGETKGGEGNPVGNHVSIFHAVSMRPSAPGRNPPDFMSAVLTDRRPGGIPLWRQGARDEEKPPPSPVGGQGG
jgi:hypothetical protein